MTRTKILLVDDRQENNDALARLIEADDVEIFQAANAEQALELVTEHDFGLALLDVQMPGTSGFELAKIIRGVKKFRSMPIIFVTAHQQDSSVIFEGYQSGAVDLLFKPLTPSVVRAKVRMFVELSQQRLLLQSHVRELERLRLEAEAANIAKSQFLANMSHEIRTPLAAVMGFAELIVSDKTSDSEKDDCISAVRRNGKLLMKLIDDILDLSKIEANRLELENTEFSFGEILRDIHSTLSFRAQEKGIELEFKNPPKGFPLYRADSTRVKQVLLNIIGNAVKFTASGKVTVDVGIAPRSLDTSIRDTLDRITVRVTDQGVGLSHAQADRLFQPFGQADASTRRRFGGSGLGLVISRQIARAMGGDIRLISSTPGVGSVFEVEFIMERASKEAGVEMPKREYDETNLDRSILAGKRILAVDDSPDNLTLLSMFLKDTGAELTFAESGPKAIGETERSEFDIILMDVQMPGMDGHEATEKIRSLGFKNPIIALTAHAIRSEHDKCRRSGCNSVLTKPITRLNLLKNLYEYAGSPTPAH